MRTYFLDSNIFLRIFTADNEKMLSDCISLIEKVKLSKFKIVTSNFVLAEIVWTLSSTYHFDRVDISEAVNTIINLSGLKIDDGCDNVLALNLYANKAVKYIDALIASNPEIQSKKMTVVSYDIDFDKLGVKRLEPKDLVK